MACSLQYMVTGFPRSGTSMMMACLEAGGMKCYKSQAREQFREACRDDYYDPNPFGIYEPESHQLKGSFGDTAVKVLIHHLDRVSSCKHSIVMRRDPEEIRQSLEAFTGERLGYSFVRSYNKHMDNTIVRLKDICISVVIAEYTGVISNPIAFFNDLNWPIDSNLASRIVDPSLYRFRRELLIVGA